MFLAMTAVTAGMELCTSAPCEAVVNWSATLNVEQQVEQGVAVFAAGETDHYPVAIVNHAEVGDSFAHPAQ